MFLKTVYHNKTYLMRKPVKQILSLFAKSVNYLY